MLSALLRRLVNFSSRRKGDAFNPLVLPVTRIWTSFHDPVLGLRQPRRARPGPLVFYFIFIIPCTPLSKANSFNPDGALSRSSNNTRAAERRRSRPRRVSDIIW